MIEDILTEAELAMDTCIEAFKADLASMRTGRASTGLVSKLLVDFYGSPTVLQEIALLSVPEAQLIAIKPYDPSSIKAIEKAIITSGLGLNPNNDGKIIRLQVPGLTEQRRRDLTKMANKRAEEARVSIRNSRRDGVAALRHLEKDKAITEDDLRESQEDLQKLTDEYIKKINDITTIKDKEIMEV